MLADLSGRTALITGAARGIGRGTALILAAQGADVALADINQEAAARVAQEIQALGRVAVAEHVDVTSAASALGCVNAVLSRMGQIDILVNNAGVLAAPGWHDTEPGTERDEDWDLTYEVNVKGIMHMCEAVRPHLTQRRYGKIINIASIAGRRGTPLLSSYAASKAAVINYTQSLALRLAKHNINVNAVCPGLLWTDMWEAIAARIRQADPTARDLSTREAFERDVRARIPLKREQTPEDIGKLVAFLASDDARNITGQAIHVDGGAVMV